eukprot:jgi/Botrbrau1/22707/Bobra.0132s0046.1
MAPVIAVATVTLAATSFRPCCVHTGTSRDRVASKPLEKFSARGLWTSTQKAVVQQGIDMTMDTRNWLEYLSFTKGGHMEEYASINELREEQRKNEQLEKENVSYKSRISSLQSSLVQAEHANALSADTILHLKAEIASAEHLDRLAHGNDFLSARKDAQALSEEVASLRMELRKVKAQRDKLRSELLACLADF